MPPWTQLNIDFLDYSHIQHTDVANTEAHASSAGPVARSSLNGALFGLQELEPEPAAYFFGFYANYSESPDRSLVLNTKSVRLDSNKLGGWTREFVRVRVEMCRCDSTGSDLVDARSMRERLIARPRDVPAVISLALHTELRSGERAFLAPGLPLDFSFDSPAVIRYPELCEILSAPSCPSSIALLIDSCFSDNVMCLPIMNYVEYVNGQYLLRWKETGASKVQEWESKPLMIQSAATMPQERAISFKRGTVYTQAFNNSWDKPFKCMMKSMQECMDSTFKAQQAEGGKRYSQHHVLYSSRAIDNNESIWLSLGLQQKPPVEPDSSG